jgi:hypothetical protein
MECILKIHLTILLVGYSIVSTAVKEVINVAQNNSVVEQKFWLQADPFITRAPLNPPFTGCIFFLQTAPGSSLIDGHPPNILCQNVLPDDCEQTIFDLIQSNITALSNATLDDSFRTWATLSNILRTPLLECKEAK